MNNIIKIAVFKPTNIRNNNAFATGQHIVFEELNKKKEFEISYFTDDENTYFENVKMIFLKKNNYKTFENRIIRRLLGKFYMDIPSFSEISFEPFDVVITEGFHYPLLHYLKNYKGVLLFNDSITLRKMITKAKVNEFNKHFSGKTSILVNGEIRNFYLQNKIDTKIEVIGHAIDTKKIRFDQRYKFNGNIVSVGRLSKEKGFEVIIKALKILDYKGYKFRLDIYGDGPQRESLIKLITELNLSKKIFLKGYIDNIDLFDKFKNYSLFISHPIETNFVAEAFNMSQAEAMCFGIPAITSSCGGMETVYKNSLIYTEQNNERGLSQKILKLISNNNQVKFFSKFGSDYIRSNYDLTMITDKWLRMIKSKF